MTNRPPVGIVRGQKGANTMNIHTLSVEVFRFPLGDCTNRGVSSRFKSLAIACPDGPDVFDADVAIPLNFCMVERRRISNIYGRGEYVYMDVVPATVDERGQIIPRPGWWMNGGNIVDTCDSRFRSMTAGYPLRIHDRQE